MKSTALGLVAAVTFSALALGCGSTAEPASGTGGAGPRGTGGRGMASGGANGASGGTSGSGGANPTGTGGANPGTGGAAPTGSGGAPASSGGATGSGGASSTGTGGGGAATGGATGSGGRITGSGGITGRGGSSGTGGAPAAGGTSGSGGAGGGVATGRFSFFVTSLGAMRRLSGNQMGFGGDLRYGEATGLAGADKICREVAESAMTGAGSKTWRAFLSTVAGPVHAIDRVGEGPWYDRMGRLVAMNKADLMQVRPRGAHPAIIDDLPNELGIPNHLDGAPGCTGNSCPDNHDILTGTNAMGRLYSTNLGNTCNDWTNAAATNPGGRGLGPWCGHSWPRIFSGVNWMSALAEGGCGPGVNLLEMGGPMSGVYTVGTGGGYGGIYCFALTP